MHTGYSKNMSKKWHFSNEPAYFSDAIWKKDQINKAAGQKWRHEETNHMYVIWQLPNLT